MPARVLPVNGGSSSIKPNLYAADASGQLIFGHGADMAGNCKRLWSRDAPSIPCRRNPDDNS